MGDVGETNPELNRAIGSVGEALRITSEWTSGTRNMTAAASSSSSSSSSTTTTVGRIAHMSLPDSATTCVDYAAIASYMHSAMVVVDAAFFAAIDSAKFMDDPRCSSALGDIAIVVGKITEEAERFWVNHAAELDTETTMLSVDATETKLTTPQYSSALTTSHKLSRLVALGRVSLFALLDRVSSSGQSECISGITAASFDGVRVQMLCQTTKPIVSYTAAELVGALDAISLAWKDLDFSGDVIAYVNLLALRYGMFARSPLPASDYGADPALVNKLGRATVGDGMYIPSRHFVGTCDARLRSLIGMSRSVLGTRSDAPESLLAAISSELSVPRAAPPRCVASGAPRFEARSAVMNVVSALAAFADKYSCIPAMKEMYSPIVMECAVGPGDDGVLATTGAKYSRSAKNVAKILHGKNYVFDAYWASAVERVEVVLASALKREYPENATFKSLSCSKCTAFPSEVMAASIKKRRRVDGVAWNIIDESRGATPRSRFSLEEEIAGLCAFELLFASRTHAPWMSTFVVGRDARIDMADVIGIGCATPVPVVVLLANAFEVAFNGTRYRMGSAFEAIAWWLELVLVFHDGRLPVARGSDALAKRTFFGSIENSRPADGDAPSSYTMSGGHSHKFATSDILEICMLTRTGSANCESATCTVPSERREVLFGCERVVTND